MDLVTDAERLARDALAIELPRRWAHVQSVAAKAKAAAALCTPQDGMALVAAAWLHDVGYSTDAKASGLHALDGARWLRRRGFDERVANLVAYHSCAIFEAAERGLADQLRAEFVDEASPVRDALWYADMTTGPDGQSMTVRERLAEVRVRYGQDHAVTRFWAKAEPALLEAVVRVEDRLAAARVQPMYGSDRCS